MMNFKMIFITIKLLCLLFTEFIFSAREKLTTASNLMTCHIIISTAGPPPAPVLNPITVVDEGSMDSTSLIRWNWSDCAVQYVVTIINSSDDRVYPNITTSNTNTAVTLPTGVEFCVTLVAVDSIGRRGPDSIPTCYRTGENWCQNAAIHILMPRWAEPLRHTVVVVCVCVCVCPSFLSVVSTRRLKTKC